MPRNAIYIWYIFLITIKFLQIQRSCNFVHTFPTKVYGGHEVIFHKLYISAYMEVNWQVSHSMIRHSLIWSTCGSACKNHSPWEIKPIMQPITQMHKRKIFQQWQAKQPLWSQPPTIPNQEISDTFSLIMVLWHVITILTLPHSLVHVVSFSKNITCVYMVYGQNGLNE